VAARRARACDTTRRSPSRRRHLTRAGSSEVGDTAGDRRRRRHCHHRNRRHRASSASYTVYTTPAEHQQLWPW